jgi:hypothetical protein
MVRQRITQDFQLVSEDNVNASSYRPETLRQGVSGLVDSHATDPSETQGAVRHFLSMGHRLQVLSYDPVADVVEVTRYTAKQSQRSSALNTFKYQYFTYCQETRNYSKVVQTFDKYTE